MQQRRVYARFGGDVLHAGAGGAAAEEDDVRRVEDALLGVAVTSSRSAAFLRGRLPIDRFI